MKKFSNSINLLVTIPVILFIFFILSIISILAYPHYSDVRIYFDVNENNSSMILEQKKGSNSSITNTSDESTAGFDCTIGNEQVEPLCRMQIWITQDKTQGIDLTNYHTLKVYGNYISPSHLDFLRVSLRNYEPSVQLKNEETKFKFNLVEIQSNALTQPIEVDFKRLIVPNWWMVTVSDQNIKGEVDLTNISLIEVSTANENSAGDYKLHISAIELHKTLFTLEELYAYLLIFWAATFLIIFILVTIFMGSKLNQKFKNEKILLEINRSLSIRSEKLEISNKTDELTHVLNRNGMKDKMMECLSRNWFPMCAAMIDIDFFKRINDELGHQKGDEVLIVFGELLNNFIQGTESVSRYGGEEFLILLPNSSASQIHARLEQLRIDISQSDFGSDLTVTASFGVASCDKKEGFNTLVEKADKALYEAKNNGRNRINYTT